MTAPTLGITLSTLGYTDTVRGTTNPWNVSFGQSIGATTRDIGPAGSGQTLAGSAADVAVTSNTDWVLQTSATQFSDGAGDTLPTANFRYKHNSVAEAWTPFPTAATTVEGPSSLASTTFSYDWELVVPALQHGGVYQSTVTYTVLPAI